MIFKYITFKSFVILENELPGKANVLSRKANLLPCFKNECFPAFLQFSLCGNKLANKMKILMILILITMILMMMMMIMIILMILILIMMTLMILILVMMTLMILI